MNPGPGALGAAANALFDALAEGVVLHAGDGTIVACNAAAERLLGTTAAALVGHASLFPVHAVRTLDGRTLAPAAEPAWHLLMTGESSAVPVCFAAPDGERVLELCAVRVPPGDGGAASPSVATLLRAREPAEAALSHEHRDDLERAGLIAGAVAHEFNNLLTVILGYTEVLLASGGPHLRIVQEVERAAEQGARLTRQLLAVTRGVRLEHEALALDAALEARREFLARALGATRHLELALHAGALRVGLEPARLEQLLLVALENARHATAPNGTVCITTAAAEHLPERALAEGARPPGRYVRLEVRDDGAGMSPHTARHALDPFFGTRGAQGVGLALAHGIARACGGHLEVTSELGRGTALQLYLPVLDAVREEARPATGRTGS